MGFGSYDESEQEKRNQSDESDDDAEGVSMNREEGEGEVTFETGGTDELLSVYQSKVTDEE
jgi:hypothetical protein